MKVRDARQKILMRRKYHSTRQQPKDARQIIEQKRKLKKLEMNKLKQHSSHNNDHVQRSQFTGKQGLRKTVKNSLSNLSKSVSLRDGMITVTARQSPKKHQSSKFPTSGKQIIANNGEITVVKINTGSLGDRRPETLRNRHDEDMDIEMAEIAGSSSSWELQSPLHLKSMSATTSDLRSSISIRQHQQQIPTAIPSYLDNAHPLQQGSFSAPHLPPSSSVLVTNLHPSVSEDDILELFSDIGAIRSTRFLQPGTAVVYYLRKADAEKACLAYHNRLLDGLPMQCTILPESSMADKISMHKSDQRMSATPLQPHPGLTFSSGKTSHKPVKFTVRLP